MKKLIGVWLVSVVLFSCAQNNPYVNRLSQVKLALSKQDYAAFAKNIEVFSIVSIQLEYRTNV